VRFAAGGVDFVQISALAVVKVVFLAGCVLALAHSCFGLARVLRGIELSYVLYLYHVPLFATLSGFGLARSGYSSGVGFGGALALAALSWFLNERRFLRLKAEPRARAAQRAHGAAHASAPRRGPRARRAFPRIAPRP